MQLLIRYVCSKKGLSTPNMRCPKGFYCLKGTQTSSPFRNDTTLRPLPCSPGTYCLDGVGNNTVKEGDFFFAQPCAAGFYCEAASVSPQGSGLCPPSFTCKKGTATPEPTPKGYYSELFGAIHATECLPGTYSPTIETTKCYPCPPGTECEEEGMSEAEVCPPGKYRSYFDGIPCLSCPDGTWSKNSQLGDVDECLQCAPGLACGIEGMTNPCSKNDLPTPFEPILNLNGKVVPEYLYPLSDRPPQFSLEECLQLNWNDTKILGSDNQQFFYGELIPPYIDVLGRGAYIRQSDDISAKYGQNTKCYRNKNPQGSTVYKRMREFHGPQYIYHKRFPNQGYGSANELNLMFEIAPLNGILDTNLKYYHGKGSMYIDLPGSSIFDPSFNCTPGFQLMNETLTRQDKVIVYTSDIYDYSGGVDIEKCPFFDEILECYIDPTFQLHDKGQCCTVQPWNQRAIFMGEDQIYTGTCEADLICSEETSGEAVSCKDGFVCESGSNVPKSLSIPCEPGYRCSPGSTRDISLQAPQGQYKNMCKAGSYCTGGNGLLHDDFQCMKGFFCPTGTASILANSLTGSLSDDSLKRNLQLYDIDPQRQMNHLIYLGNDIFNLINDHDARCMRGSDKALRSRYWTHLGDELVRKDDKIEKDLKTRGIYGMNIAESLETSCSRDNKWSHINSAVQRNECDCISQFTVCAAVYRLWKVSTNLAIRYYLYCFSILTKIILNFS